MTLRIVLDHDLPPIFIMSMNAQMNVSNVREGGFYEGRYPGGCGRYCRWNGGGYYNDIFTCGQFYRATSSSSLLFDGLPRQLARRAFGIPLLSP